MVLGLTMFGPDCFSKRSSSWDKHVAVGERNPLLPTVFP